MSNLSPQPLPSDVYEVDLLGAGDPGTPYSEVTAPFGLRFGTAPGPTGTIFVPTVVSVRRDYAGAAVVPLVCTVVGSAGNLAPGTTLYIDAGAAGTTSGAARVSMFSTFARQLALLLGPAYQPADGTLIAQDFTALGGVIALARATSLRSLDQAFGDTAMELLDGLEMEYGLAMRSDLSPSLRQARLVAKIRAQIDGTPNAIEGAAHVLDQTARIYENTAATVPQEADRPGPPGIAGGARLVFSWYLRVKAATFASPSLKEQLDALCRQMRPAHTAHVLGTNDASIGFLTDDPDSLTDRDVLSA